MFFKKFFESFGKFMFFVITYDNIYGFILFLPLACRLHITTGGHDDGIRILLPCTMYHLSGFTVRHIGHGTGVDDIHLCLLLKRNNFISCLFKYLLHCLCFISIDFTAQIMQCCSSHTFSFIFPLLWLTFLIKKITLKQTSIVTMGGLLI